MKKIVYIIFLLYPVAVFSQPASSVDFGGGIGISSYYGDINQERPFYNAKAAFEVFTRYNFNNRYALRVQMLGTRIEAADKDFESIYQRQRNMSFVRSVTEIAVVGEVNFFPYVNPAERLSYVGTLYGLIGFGRALTHINHENKIGIPVVLMGVGYKRALWNRWAFEMEGGFRKCLNDRFDEIIDPIKTGKQSALFNNDWYNVFAVKLSYNFWRTGGRCRTFERDAENGGF